MRYASLVVAASALFGCGSLIGLDANYTDGTLDGGDALLGGDDGANGDGPNPCTNGEVCVNVPTGWAFAPFSSPNRLDCKPGYGSPMDVVEGVSGAAATCACACDVAQPSCALYLSWGKGSKCSNRGSQTETASSGCQTLSSALNTNGDNASASAPDPPNGGGCAGKPTKQVGAASFTPGRICSPTAAPTVTCEGSGGCVPAFGAFAKCISHAGIVTCPADFPSLHEVGTINDTRDCTACTCSFSPGACAGNVTFYTDTACTQAPLSMAVDATCQGTTSDTFSNYTYSRMTKAMCAPSDSTPTGSASLSTPLTVCCAN